MCKAEHRWHQRFGAQCFEAEPVITVCLASNPAPDAQQLHGVSVIAHLLRPWLLKQQERSRWWGQRLLRAAKRQGAELVNPKSPVRNISAAVLSLLLAGVVFGTWPYRIEAAGELSTDSVQVISAPFHGFLAQLARHAQPSPRRGRCGAVRFAWAKTVEAQRG
jgi:hypothetical protein